MVTHMKTTIEIADSLLDEAKRLAARERRTLKALVEDGLRRVLKERRVTREPFRLRDASFLGKGLQPHLADAPWEAIRGLIYGDRGGR
jgi:hypothetical protein